LLGMSVFSAYIFGPVSETIKWIDINVLCNTIALLAFAGIILSPITQRALSCDASRFVGGISFPLYLVHFLVMTSLGAGLFILLYQKLNVGFGLTFLVVAPTVIVVSILSAVIFRNVIEDFVLRHTKMAVKAGLASLANQISKFEA